jgi:type IV pilus assembly protein PilB
MDKGTFKKFFPGFPIDNDSLEKLHGLLVGAGVVDAKVWEGFEDNSKTPLEFIEKLAGLKEITPEILAKAEADLLNLPFVKVDEVEISQDAYKLISADIIKKRLILPIRITGAELVVGTIEPSNLSLFDDIKISLAIKPAKVLFDALENKISQMSGSSTPKKSHQRKRLGDILVELNYCKPEQLDEAFKGARDEKLRLGAYLVKHGVITNKHLSIALSKQFNIPYIDLDESLVDPVLATLLPQKLCYEHILCPVKRENGKLVLAMHDPTDIITIDHIEMMTGMRISPVVSSELSIMASLDNLYGDSVDSLADSIGSDDPAVEGGDEMEMGENDAPIIKLVNLILTQAVTLNVSDIHVEVYEHEFRIRFRQDGIMKLFMTPAKAAHSALVSRIKVMSNLDIAETRRPQDGRIKMNMQNRKIDLRVSCIPCVWGEKIVMRICDQGNLKVDLKELGFEPFVLEKFMGGVQSANGIVLVTGPTGSGKTTTLYSSLFLLNNPSVNIMTAEDPVEYNLMGINQVQCHADIGLDFSAALRSFLRQDPDVVMLGEIRDFETASIAIKAAMTGHLVISTLHTNDAPATVARLLNMGIEPFSLSTSLRIVQAQRLVKRVCKTCAEEYKPDVDLLQSLGINEKTLKRLHLDDQFTLDTLVFKKGAGCPECDNTGLKGRQGIYEVLEMTPEFRELIEGRATTEDMRRRAIADGMLSLRESALYKLITGITNVQEVFNTTVDAGGHEDGEAEEKPKMAESSSDEAVQRLKEEEEKKKREEEKKQQEVITLSTIPQNGISDLAAELQEFNGILSKLSSMGGSASAVNAELLNANIVAPLQNIKAYASKPEQAAKALPVIRAQGQKMEYNVKNLVTHFVDFKPKFVKAQLNQLVEREIFGGLKEHVVTARLISGLKNVGKTLKLSKNLPEKLPLIKVDAVAFSTIVSNVLINALIGLGDKGGEIKVVTRVKPNSKQMLELILVDNGVGIAPERQARLFEPFSGEKSLGLGLAVSKKLINAIGGDIKIKSTLGKSTMVTMEFPIIA